MSKVVSLFSGQDPTAPSQDIIGALAELLERAKAGEIAAIAWTRVDPGGEIATGWDGVVGTRNSLGFAIRLLDADFIQKAADIVADE